MQNRKHGFTMAELLIVVAVVAVLVAIAFPLFSRKLEAAREAYDIYTMRQAASAAVSLYYAGVTDEKSAKAAGLLWNSGTPNDTNAYGVYDPKTGSFLNKKSSETGKMSYGKGTKVDGGTTFIMGNSNGAYKADEDYTTAVVMIAIYPMATNKHVDIYWKTSKSKYVGGPPTGNNPKYSIRIPLS